MARKIKTRRGALLIVVLSILVLFALIGLTFVVVAGTFNRAAKAAGRAGITDDEGRQLVERSFMELLRGTTDSNSVLWGLDTNGDGVVDGQTNVMNCLLEDLYGPSYMAVPQGAPAPIAGELRVLIIPAPGEGPSTPIEDFYAGRLISYVGKTTGETSAAGLLTNRIKRNAVLASRPALFIDPFQSEMLGSIPTSDIGPNSLYVINGRPYSGLDTVGQNESWDAPDWANPFLAYVPAAATSPTQIIPSFWDRALADTNGDGVPDASYTGSGTPPLPVVDNDRDGIDDSLWLDLRLPQKTAADGRLYKPLVAFLCLDLDGRLHVNAHGSEFQPNTSTDLLGQGVGPADIQLTSLPNWANVVAGRYGSDGVPGTSGTDLETDYIFYRGPQPYNDTAAVNRLYGGPIDLEGDGLITLDGTGQPTYTNLLTDTIVDSPYEINLTRPNGRDALYTAPDLERVLRWWDVDSPSLSQRLQAVLSIDPATTAAAEVKRLQRSITTHSARVAVPRIPGGFLRFVLDENNDGTVDSPRPLTMAQVNELFPREVVEGGKMDLNRPWGDVPTTAEYKRSRHAYAKQLFCLMMFSMDRDTADRTKIVYRIPLAGGETLSDAEHYELTVRRIAQWAVNIVDFRDPDATMTLFEYDTNPFDGWHVKADANIEDTEIATVTLTNPDGVAKTVSHYRGVETVRLVWGCEYPELIMTETHALHDRRTKDTAWDDNMDQANEDPPPAGSSPNRGQKRIHQDYDPASTDPADEPKGDKDLDQFRIPLGSLFIELAAMRNTSANDPIFPAELYNSSGQLELAKMDAGGMHPVWRIAVSVPHHGSADGNVAAHSAAGGETRNSLNPATRRTTYPNTISFQPQHMSLLPLTSGSEASQLKWLEMERFVWFTATAPSDAAPEAEETVANTFVAAAAGATIDAGQHFVVAPRASTAIGSQPTPSVTPADQNDAANPIDVSSVTYIICQGQTTAGDTVGVNISEPLLNNHYPQPTAANEQYDDGMTAVTGTEAGQFPDVPFDGDSAAAPLRPLKASELIETGTQSNYKTAFLQRLADPTIAWHPVRNPYITVDWQPLDLTVYNGEDQVPEMWDETAHGDFDPEDPNVDEVTAADLEAARERGETANVNKWRQAWTMRNWVDNTNANFSFYPEQSLGTLNSNLSGGFPWIVWPNRPFVGHYDLMLVPFTSSGRLLHDFRIDGTPFPYGHLLNFTLDSGTAADNSAYYRVLELVETPSRYIGSQRWLLGSAYPTAPPAPPTAPPHAANYKHSNLRDPGVMNINTIPGEDAYLGLTQGHYAAWADFQSRRKGNSGSGDMLGRFTNVARGPWVDLDTSDAQRTLLVGGPTDGSPLLGSVATAASVQHPYKYFERLLRLGNLTATQSNVFAVWVTVGYFEVNPANGALVRELGSDTGEIRRHRGFYIVDRSIPVAYERGKDHNVDRTILLRRYVE